MKMKERTFMIPVVSCSQHPSGHSGYVLNGGEMTLKEAKDKVLAVYPNATISHCAAIWEVWKDEKMEGNYREGRLGHSILSPLNAWIDASYYQEPFDPEKVERFTAVDAQRDDGTWISGCETRVVLASDYDKLFEMWRNK